MATTQPGKSTAKTATAKTATTQAAAATPTQSDAAGSGRLRLVGATALVIGSVVGVGIFNLPTSLAAYGPITLFSMALTTVGALALARLFA